MEFLILVLRQDLLPGSPAFWTDKSGLALSASLDLLAVGGPWDADLLWWKRIAPVLLGVKALPFWQGSCLQWTVASCSRRKRTFLESLLWSDDNTALRTSCLSLKGSAQESDRKTGGASKHFCAILNSGVQAWWPKLVLKGCFYPLFLANACLSESSAFQVPQIFQNVFLVADPIERLQNVSVLSINGHGWNSKHDPV